MTRLPIESRLAVDRPDLPEYELNKACPVTGEVTGLENHHIWRRSAGYPSWWVELPDGTVVGNRINLSSAAHNRLTVNKARIEWKHGYFYWTEANESIPLKWQPPLWDEQYEQAVWPKSREEDVWVYTEEKVNPDIFSLANNSGDIEPGHDCPTCKRRVPIPKKKSSPQTKVFSTRVPIDDAETFKSMVDAAAEHHGLKSKAHFPYWTLLYGLTILLQLPAGELPA